jgi:RHS repeat-associated protein
MLKTRYSQRSRQRLRYCVLARVSAHACVQAWTYDANNRLTQRGSSPCTSSGPNTGITCYDWDEAGNLTQKTQGTGTSSQSTRVTQNRLIEVQDTTGGQTNPAATLIARYGYDPLDRRIWKEQYRDANGQGQSNPLAPAQRTYYLYADEGLIAESTQAITLNADGSVSASSTPQISTQYGPRPGSEFTTGTLFVKTKNSNGQDSFAYLHHDHLQTPLQATDKAGNVVWAASYNAFDKASITTPAATPDKPTINVNLRLPGQYLDEETGLHYNYRRYYDADSGRYVTQDPIGFGGGVNLYRYANHNPINYADPRGEFLIVPILIGAGGGALTDIAIQLLTNGGNTHCINWNAVAVSAGLGALGGGIGGYVQKLRDVRQAYQSGLTAAREAELTAAQAHAARRELGRGLKEATPPGARDWIYGRNARKYGDPLGPPFDPVKYSDVNKTLTDTNRFLDGLLQLPETGLAGAGGVIGGVGGAAASAGNCKCQ